VRLVRCEDGRLEIGLEPTAGKTLVNDLARKLGQWTGRPWSVEVSRQQAAPTLKAQDEARKQELRARYGWRPLDESATPETADAR